MAYFEHFNPFVDYVPTWPFRRLNGIALRASRLLAHRDLADLTKAANAIDEAIAERKARYVEGEIDAYAERLASRGGWELEYLAGLQQEVSESSIRHLLTNWPADADDRPDLPDADDFADADALQEALDYDYLEDPCRAWNKDLPDYNSTPELWAIFVLMKVEDTLGWLGWIRGNRWLSADTAGITKGRLAIAGESAMEAAEGLVEMERLRTVQSEQFAIQYRAEGRLTAADAFKDREHVRKRKADEARNGPRREARAFVWKQWEKELARHGDDANKTVFSDFYALEIPKHYLTVKGVPLVISARQIREEWLCGPPAAPLAN